MSTDDLREKLAWASIPALQRAGDVPLGHGLKPISEELADALLPIIEAHVAEVREQIAARLDHRESHMRASSAESPSELLGATRLLGSRGVRDRRPHREGAGMMATAALEWVLQADLGRCQHLAGRQLCDQAAIVIVERYGGLMPVCLDHADQEDAVPLADLVAAVRGQA